MEILFERTDTLCACVICATSVAPADGMRISQPSFGAGCDAWGEHMCIRFRAAANILFIGSGVQVNNRCFCASVLSVVLQANLTLGLELSSRFPLRIGGRLGNTVSDHPVILKLLDGAAHIPIRTNDVGGFVVVLCDVLLHNLHAISLRFAHVVNTVTARQSGHALLGKGKVIRPVEAPFFRGRIRLDDPTLLRRDPGGNIVQV